MITKPEKKAPFEGNDLAAVNDQRLDLVGQDGGGSQRDAVKELHDFWVERSKDAFATSTDYLESECLAQWQKNLDNFDSKHPQGSKYYTDAYRHRSRLFRPKTRAAESKAEAAFAEAMFGSSEILTVEPADHGSKKDAPMAEVWQALLNRRVRRDIPWYKLSIGAFQSTWLYGVAISRQEWVYEEEVEIGPITIGDDGIERSQARTKVKASKSRSTLVDPVLFRFDPRADWTDPIGTSPYLIEIIPMYIDALMRFMKSPTRKGGEDAWLGATRGEVLAANRDHLDNMDTARRQRYEDDGESDSFRTIWVHRNIIQDEDGTDHEFYSVGDSFLLSWPMPLEGPVGRNYVLGVSNIEAFRPIPASRIQLAEMVQAEANELVNQQVDNVKLALNRGYIVQRNKNVDLSTLRRSYPGRIVMTDDLNAVRPEQLNDVTSSSYASQDRLNNDMDDIVGGFSQGSVATQAALGRTVGGMQMVQGSSNAVTTYIVRTFVETWVEPTLNQILRLTQEYEEDDVIRKYWVDRGADNAEPSLDDVLKSMDVLVNVGFGALDPKLKVQTMVSSFQTAMAVAPGLAAKVDEDAVLAELAAVAGYRDGTRFLLDEEQLKQRQQQAAEQAAAMQPPPAPPDGSAELARAKVEIEARKVQLEEARVQLEAQDRQAKLALERELGFARIAAQENLTVRQLETKLGIDLAKADLAEREHNLRIAKIMGDREGLKVQREEMMLKEQMGSGI